ncbi:efflux RND transporter permease subunit [Marnyiella aurantia]|uniref:Efflux RND transporter permease subunit n=1 Tax=Marnyiella aurantia TaxID=2758037 RepID=A0A7D7LQT4_9FLAO|nr:efflux RND transporter permease subunit [Marnyiella aurantia]MBA5247293.1 efflux RND transporter permease subunit [Marnyiella aurantia]QMS99056.1 efflux RND transporter permease subunit [Marnyiella aurantia]
MIKKFINRPVLSTVISILIVILGILGLVALPVTQYPDIAPPTVRISANYTGANAQTVMNSVIIPIEEQVNGVEGMDYISSSAGNNGSASIQVFFKQGIDPDIAAVNVQNQVQRALPLLPSEVTRSGVQVNKQQTSALMFLSFYTSNPDLDEVWLQNYMNINIIPAIKRVNGVGDASAFGGKTYSMRIWLDPAKMAAYGLEPSEVSEVISEQSREAAAGQLGENSGSSFQYVITYKGKHDEVEEYENIVVRALGNGEYLRLKDVADIKLDALSYGGIGENNGRRSVSMGIFQTPGSNAQNIIKDIKILLEETEKTLPEGIGYSINFDTNDFLEASISKVITTLIEAFILVFLVVFLFLQDFRSTLIPAIAVPVSIIGTLFFLNLLGYSLNLLTLFALVLAIGIVVDDAIVVVEAVHAKLEQGYTDAKKATVSAMDEITGAIISITLVMAAVFIPVTFLQGPTGVFYQQFGITLIIAILISAVNALTLSPVLCSLFLKPSAHHHKAYSDMNFGQKFFAKFNIGFRAVTNKYGRSFVYLLRHKWITLLIFAAGALTFWWANSTMPTGFIPKEDRGIIFTDIQLPPGSSMERTYNVLKDLQEEARKIPGVQNVTFTASRGFMSGQGSNVGQAFIRLKPFDERGKEDGQDVETITKKLFGLAGNYPDAKIVFFSPPSVPGFGQSDGFSAVLLDKSGGELTELNAVTQEFIGSLMQRPEIQFASTSFNTNYPQYEMVINVPRAKESGVSVNNILSTMQGYIGGIYSSDFTKYGKQFRVMIQALPDNRKSPNNLNGLYVKTNSGAMAPISQFLTLQRSFGPQSIERYNLFTSVSISGSTNPGFSTGDAIKAVQETAGNLPGDYDVEFTGLTKEEMSAGSQTYIIFLLSFIFVYFILAAQYESYILPFAVIISLPLGVIGAYFGQRVFGLENNIYFQIAIIMLIGLLAKNAILIVEFALQRRHHGETLAMSAINAAKARLRPILMTSFAFIFGMLPLVFASGIGSVGNRSIGTGAAMGLLIGTFFGLLAIPVLFVIFQALHERIVPIKEDKVNLSE